MFLKRNNATEIEEIVSLNVGMPIEEFLTDVRFPYIKNMKEAVAMTKNFMAEHPDDQITIIGDYDVDGVTASNIMFWTFQKCGKTVKIRIPRRLSEGYGLSEKIVDEIDSGLIITVDNGIAASTAIKKAKDKGLLVIVTDHHLPPVDANGNMILPPADLIVDPHIDDESEFDMLCGAALAYFFAKEMFPDANLYPLLSLASIATVADVMPLIGVNRTLVKDGLKLVNAGRNVPGLNELIRAKEMKVVTEEDYGFVFGPIINASGRLIDRGGEKVLEVLNSKLNNPALPWKVQGLIETNEKRKDIVKESMIIAESLVTDERPIVIYHPSFEEGIVGIIAGQLTEKYNTPAIVFTRTPKGIYKGSARSTEHIHLKKALDKMQDTMLGYGGHAGAAGVSIDPDRYEEFKKAFVENVGTEDADNSQLLYDLDITENNIQEIAEELKTYAPFGEGNPKIIFHIKLNLTKGKYSVMGDGSHFCIEMPEYKVMGFGMVDKYTEMGMPKMIDALCYVGENWFGGNRSVKLELIDFVSL